MAHHRSILMSAGLLILLAACNLSAAQPTSTPSPTPKVLATTAGCAPRFDWPAYIVPPGQSIASIAERGGTTISEIASASCLENIEAAGEGAVIRVPPSVLNAGGVSCVYSGYAIGGPHGVFDAPINGNLLATVEPGQNFPISVVNEYSYLITLPSGTYGWVYKNTGGASGDCMAVPFQSIVPAAPDGVCALRIDLANTELPIVTNPRSNPTILSGFPIGQWVTAIRQDNSRQFYRVQLANGVSGWVDSAPIRASGLISGPCDALPLEDLGPGG